MYRVYRTAMYEQKLSKIREHKSRIEVIEQQLKENPYVGKPLKYAFFREKKISHRRLLYIVRERKVYLLTITTKKLQQKDIDEILKRFRN